MEIMEVSEEEEVTIHLVEVVTKISAVEPTMAKDKTTGAMGRMDKMV